MADPHPSYYERRIFLANVGLAPQILTETLYVLCRSYDPPFVPHEIHVVTTQKGRALILKTLLDPAQGKLRQFAEEFGFDVAHALTPERIHVISSDGTGLDDIDSERDNAAAADLITRIVSQLTKNPKKTAVHVSIAGGRKTMGFLLGYVLSIFGRPQDRLSHVLVSPDFESHPDFFYPPREARTLVTRDGRSVSTNDARLTLAEIPFVRLRDGLPDDLLAGRATFMDLVSDTQRIFMPKLVVDFAKRCLVCNGVAVDLEPVKFAFYAWLARRRKDGVDDDGSIHWSVANPEDLLAEYRCTPRVLPSAIEELESALRDGFTAQWIEQTKAKVNKVLGRKLGPTSIPFEIKQRGLLLDQGRYVRVGLVLRPEAIRFGPSEE